MKAYLNDDNFENDYEDDDKKRKRRIIIIIIIIIIILSLITSCGCTSKFFGKIGDLFRNEGSFNIDDDTNDTEVIKNSELTFDTDSVEMALSDVRTKISFTYKHINPNGFTCSTSNAEIATCYVSNNYVVVIPKKAGEVEVYLRTTANGKTYEASTKVVITDTTRKIELSSTNGTINLATSKYKNIPYSLIGLSGDIQVTSSDEKIATAKAENGILSITALTTGNVTITLSLNYNGMEYTAEYTLSVVNNKNNVNGSGSSNSSDTGKPSSPNTNPGSNDSENNTPGDTDDPGQSTDPSTPSKPDDNNPVYNLTISKPYPDSTYYLDIYNKENPYYIIYELTKDGTLVNEDVKIETSSNITAEIITVNGEKLIKVTPKDGVKNGDTATIIISSHGKSASTTIDFGILTHYLEINPTEYNLNYSNSGGSKLFTIDTNSLFIENMIVTSSKDNTSLAICSKDGNTCVYVNVPDEYKEYIEIFYGEADDYDDNGFAKVTDSLPIMVTLKESALQLDLENIKPILQVTASSYGTSIKVNKKDLEEITMNLVKGYKIILNANNESIYGHFSNGENQYVITVGKDEKFDFSEHIAYGIIENEDCKYYPIISYNTKPDGTGETYKLTDYVISEDLTLYAIYDTEPENISVDFETKKMYLSDVYLFRNQAYFDKYGEYEPIYPGAQGSYIITLYNNSSDSLVIQGVTLEEDTICVLDRGCLNMGYIIKYASSNATNYNYYYGNEGKYQILNQDKEKTFKSTNRYIISEQVPFGTGITIPKGEGIEISLLWQWVDTDDIADTAIGNYAAAQPEGSINDLYNLTVSIDFAKNTCSVTNKE